MNSPPRAPDLSNLSTAPISSKKRCRSGDPKPTLCCATDESTGMPCDKERSGGYLRCQKHQYSNWIANRKDPTICARKDKPTGVRCGNPCHRGSAYCQPHLAQRKKSPGQVRTGRICDRESELMKMKESGVASTEEIQKLEQLLQKKKAESTRSQNRGRLNCLIGQAVIQLDKVGVLGLPLEEACVIDYDHRNREEKTNSIGSLARYGLCMKLVKEIALCDPKHVIEHRTRTTADALARSKGLKCREQFRAALQALKRERDECAHCHRSVKRGELELMHLDFAHNAQRMAAQNTSKSRDANGSTIHPAHLYRLGSFESPEVQEQLALCDTLCVACHRRQTFQELNWGTLASAFASHLQQDEVISLQLKQVFDRVEPRVADKQTLLMQLRDRLCVKLVSWIAQEHGDQQELFKLACVLVPVKYAQNLLKKANVPFDMKTLYSVYCQHREGKPFAEPRYPTAGEIDR